jgi:hypothetical protein
MKKPPDRRHFATLSCVALAAIFLAGCQVQLRCELRRVNAAATAAITDPYGCSILSPWETSDFHDKQFSAPGAQAPVYRIKQFTLLRPESGGDSYLCLLNGDPNPPDIGIVQVNFNAGQQGRAYEQERFAHLIYPPAVMWPIERMIVCQEHPLYLLWDTAKRRAGLSFNPDKFEIELPMDGKKPQLSSQK